MEPGEIIREERKKRRWSQAQLANRIGISQVAIKKIEAGATRQSKFMPKIAQILSLDLALLDPTLNGTPAPPDLIPDDRLLGHRDFPLHASAEGGPGQVIVSSEP